MQPNNAERPERVFRYGMRMRGPGPGALPATGYIRSEPSLSFAPRMTRYGVAVYDRCLEARELIDHELAPVLNEAQLELVIDTLANALEQHAERMVESQIWRPKQYALTLTNQIKKLWPYGLIFPATLDEFGERVGAALASKIEAKETPASPEALAHAELAL